MRSGNSDRPRAWHDPGALTLPDESGGVLGRLMRSSPLGIVVTRAADGRILDVNDAFLRLARYDRAEVMGRTTLDLGIWGDPERRKAMTAALDGSTPLRDFELPLVTSTGEVRQVLASIEPVDLDGTPCLLAHLFDITERRQLEERLKVRERRFHAIFDNTFQFTGLLATDGALLEVNQTALDFAGLAPEDVIGRPFWEIPWWIHSAQTQERLRAVVRQAAQGKFIRYEVDLRGKGGAVARIDFSLKPLRDESGQVTYLIPEGRDITDVRTAEAALLESEERFRNAFELSPIGIALVAPNGRWLEVNRALCEILGYSEAELRERTFQDITHPDDLDADLALVQRLYAGEIPSYQMEKRYFRKDGDTIWVLLTASLMHAADGTATSALAQVMDITARKQADREIERALELQLAANSELERLGQAQRNFLSVFTHDFRTPLTCILGYSEVLQERREVADRAAEFAGIIADNARRLNRMVDDLLDLDRLEAGKTPIRRQPVDLGSVLSEVATLFRPHDATHHISLEIAPDLPYITGDRDALIRVVTNLVENAVKYSPAGCQVTLLARREGDAIHVEVRDGGLGIPASDLEVIFDRYARVASESTRRIRGSGLGLAIVREIIEAHGGRVWAESEPGVGSTFHITLPTPIIEPPHASGPGSVRNPRT
ncbi:MAG: PAS domain S-box protein [Chloroflexota bacterium]|nr:PAS domain S-box protein [Chloroflexota bacterium]